MASPPRRFGDAQRQAADETLISPPPRLPANEMPWPIPPAVRPAAYRPNSGFLGRQVMQNLRSNHWNEEMQKLRALEKQKDLQDKAEMREQQREQQQYGIGMEILRERAGRTDGVLIEEIPLLFLVS